MEIQSNWKDQNDPFESGLSSIVTSPAASNGSFIPAHTFMIRKVIGRLGNICNSSDISPQSYLNNPFSIPFESEKHGGSQDGRKKFSRPSTPEESSFSEQIPKTQTDSNPRKRKSIPRPKVTLILFLHVFFLIILLIASSSFSVGSRNWGIWYKEKQGRDKCNW